MQAAYMRSRSREVRHERRVRVIPLRTAGRTYDKVVEVTRLSRAGVFDICKRHETGGAKALRFAPGGPQVGEKRLLSPEQEETVQELIAEEKPDQPKMLYDLRTR